MNRKGFALLILLVAIPILAGISFVGYLTVELFYGDTSYMDKEKIVEILSKETIVLYSDGQTQLGSLFGQEHRHYVQIREMPKSLLDAVVAAEDDRFYTHFGIDPMSTARAAFRNIVLGKHEGASTITQQTVKNLYGRQKVNLLVKLKEAINAFKLERKYSKKEILEFYLNQFHVTGNGRGSGVAAKYYFNKDVSELDLVESAFIAGSVKAPVRYTPFTKRSIEAQQSARNAARVRKDYVIGRMRKLGMITEEEYAAALPREVPFKQGRFQFNELSVIELVQRQLNRKEILETVGVENLEQMGTLGLRITTTINKNVQTAAQYGLRQNLSRLEMILSGFKEEQPGSFVNIQNPEKFAFYVGEVRKIDSTPKQETVVLGLGVPECTVPTSGIDRVAGFLDRAVGRGLARSKKEFIARLKAGAHLLVSIKDIDPKTGAITCDIERRPRIQGGLIALDKGKVVSMIGGFAPYEYNRAVFAKRQPGSTFKTLTYYPALQLGWSPLDPLSNTRALHEWQDQYYFPRPDHEPETVETSLIGAGSKSENLASVWLLHNLTSRLSFQQFLDLLSTLGFYTEGESPETTFGRIAQKFNVRLTDVHLRSGAFLAARNELLNDISITSNTTLRTILQSMNYGSGNTTPQAIAMATQEDLTPKERAIRLQVLENNLLRWESLANEARPALARLKELAETDARMTDDVKPILARFRLTADGNTLAFMATSPFAPETMSSLLANPKFREATPDEILAAVGLQESLRDEENLLLDGVLPMSLLKSLETDLEARFSQAQSATVLEKLYLHDDFRYSIGMLYARQLGVELGLGEGLEWVPSWPLGSNVVTLAELAAAYQTILTGKNWRYFDNGSENQIIVIERIEDITGQLLWESSPTTHQLVDEFYSAPMLTILRGTVTNGTAYAAHNSVVLTSADRETDDKLQKSKIRVPSFGKTGTTNDYTNATYVGFLPYPEEAGSTKLNAENAYTIATYVGYDTNEPMKRGGFRVAGGVGALPAWIEAAKALIRETDYAGKMNWQKLLEEKVVEIPFDYGGGEKVYTTLHATSASENPPTESDEEEEADANTYNDYDVKRKGLMRLSLPGKTSEGLFSPQRKIHFFEPRKKAEPTATPAPAPNGN
jgi:membrane peptidoglycan carboxypeptidase